MIWRSSFKVVIWLFLTGILTGCTALSPGRRPPVNVNVATRPDEDLVQLRYASLPQPLRAIAVHYWFVAFDHAKGEWSRWEVWQNAQQVPTSWGHVHKNLMDPDSGVGGGPFRIAAEWRGREARNLIAVLNEPENYPDRDRYLAWPGPNSNTYIAWVLRRARMAFDFDPRGIGKDYRGFIGGGISPARTGVQIDTPMAGVALGLKEGVEAHALCLTFGLDLWPPALKTPLGRLGVPEPVGCPPFSRNDAEEY